MERAVGITVAQSCAVVLGCALIGLSLTRLSGGESADALFMALGGATIGLVAVALGLMFLRPVHELEPRTSPRQLIRLRIGTVGGIIAVVGWLPRCSSMAHSDTGSWSPASLTGLVGLIIYRLNHARVHLK